MKPASLLFPSFQRSPPRFGRGVASRVGHAIATHGEKNKVTLSQPQLCRRSGRGRQKTIKVLSMAMPVLSSTPVGSSPQKPLPQYIQMTSAKTVFAGIRTGQCRWGPQNLNCKSTDSQLGESGVASDAGLPSQWQLPNILRGLHAGKSFKHLRFVVTRPMLTKYFNILHCSFDAEIIIDDPER